MEMFPEVAGDEEQHEEAQQHRHPHAGDLQRVDRVVIPREQVDVGEGVLGRGGGRGQLALLTEQQLQGQICCKPRKPSPRIPVQSSSGPRNISPTLIN